LHFINFLLLSITKTSILLKVTKNIKKFGKNPFDFFLLIFKNTVGA